MAGHTTGDQSSSVKYIYELPYTERKLLCSILDMDNQWEKLGGQFMDFKVHELYEMRRAEKCGESPCDRLLQIWGHQNNTVTSLYSLLYKMKHYRGMKVLLPFIPSKYHSLAFNGEQSLTAAFHISDKERLTNNNTNSPLASHTEGATALPKPPQNLLQSSRSVPRASATAGARLVGLNNGGTSDQPPNQQPYIHNLDKPSTEGIAGTGLLKPHLVSKKIVNVPAGQSNMSCDDNEKSVCLSAPNYQQEYQQLADAKMKQLDQHNQNPPGAVGGAIQKRVAKHSLLPEQTNLSDSSVPSRKTAASEVSIRSEASSVGPTVPVISFTDLSLATNNWSKEYLLGRGGFGEVFWGTWKNTEVAVKKISNSRDSDQAPQLHISQTFEELRLLQAYRHDNILQLYGCSADQDQPACLVYQFMVNGSVEDRLQCRRMRKLSVGEDFLSSHPSPLDWWQRLSIAIGTAKALQFLHTVKEQPLIHGDIKSANILLDRNFQPKLGDFGLAREGPMSPRTSKKVSRVHGTKPYIPDEYLRDKKLSTKVDCYSYGVVLFELCTGLKAYCEKRQHKYLKDLVCECTDYNTDSLQDPKAGYDVTKVFQALLQLGKECVVRLAKKRPDMASVYQRLEDFNKQDQSKRMSQMTSFASSPSSPTRYNWGIHDSNIPSNGYPTISTNPSSPMSFYLSNMSNQSSIPPHSRITSPEQNYLIHQHNQRMQYHPQHLLPKYYPHHSPTQGSRYLIPAQNLQMFQRHPIPETPPIAIKSAPKSPNPIYNEQLLPDLSALSLKPDEKLAPVSNNQGERTSNNPTNGPSVQINPPTIIHDRNQVVTNSLVLVPQTLDPNTYHDQSAVSPVIPLVVDELANYHESSNYHATESEVMLPMLTVLGNKDPSEVDLQAPQEDESQSTLLTDLSCVTSSSSSSATNQGSQSFSGLSAKGKSSFFD